MSIRMWDVFRDPLIRRCDPLMSAGQSGMDRMVRWVYAQERYDVTRFLQGGELLVTEGSALVGLDDDALGAYIDALADASVSGLMVELVDFLATIPEAVAERADARGLPVIGLRRRMPFVDICQRINTRIVREQIVSRMRLDDLSTALRRRMVDAQSVQDVADAVGAVLGEGVAILGADAEMLAGSGVRRGDAQDGRRGDGLAEWHGGGQNEWRDESFAVIPVRAGRMLVATLAVTQRFSILDDAARAQVASIVGGVLSSFLPQRVAERMRARLIRGADDGMCAGAQEMRDCEEMLEVLGFLKGSRCFVFALVFSSLRSDLPDIARRLRGAMPSDGNDAAVAGESGALFELEGDVIYGCFLNGSAGVHASEFNERCRTVLTTFLSTTTWIVAGVGALGASGLLNGFAALRYAVSHDEANYGHMTPVNDCVLGRMMSIPDTGKACDTVIGQLAGAVLPSDRTLVRTLCALADSAGDKTEACARLGIRRQTLYNRLDKVTELTGIEQRDRKGWNSLLFAANLIAEKRKRG